MKKEWGSPIGKSPTLNLDGSDLLLPEEGINLRVPNDTIGLEGLGPVCYPSPRQRSDLLTSKSPERPLSLPRSPTLFSPTVYSSSRRREGPRHPYPDSLGSPDSVPVGRTFPLRYPRPSTSVRDGSWFVEETRVSSFGRFNHLFPFSGLPSVDSLFRTLASLDSLPRGLCSP